MVGVLDPEQIAAARALGWVGQRAMQASMERSQRTAFRAIA
jgi:hypothetical protein